MAFLYLVLEVANTNSNWESLYHNLRKSRRQWEVVEKVLTGIVVTVQSQAILYRAVVYTVLLYGR